MTRLQLDSSGILVAVSRPHAGRSAYLHPTPVCTGALLKTRLLKRSLHRDFDRSAREGIIERLGGPVSHERAAFARQERRS
jgi:predicted RNA-binding protein YlxR (DUF448 family)